MMRTFTTATRSAIAAAMIGAAALGLAGTAAANHDALVYVASHATSHIHQNGMTRLRSITDIDGDWMEDGGHPGSLRFNGGWIEDGGHPVPME